MIRDPNPDTDVCWICPINVVYALSCRRQSFRQVWYKSAVDCMINANKCQKNLIFRNGEENEKVIRITSVGIAGGLGVQLPP